MRAVPMRKAWLENCTLPMVSPSEATVPAPISQKNGFSNDCSVPKFEPVEAVGASFTPEKRR